MLDHAILVILLLLAWAAWQRAWIGLLGLMVVGYLHPQGYATGMMRGLPIYQVLFLIVAASAAVELVRSRQWPDWRRFLDWRILLLALFWLDLLVTTYLAKDPWAAWPRFLEVSKSLLPLVLLVLLIDTRQKVTWLLLATALSIGAVVVKGGSWAILTGLQDRVYGPPDSHLSGNNEFAVAVIMILPLLALWIRHADRAPLRWALYGLLALGYVAVLSSWSRGALLGLGVVTALLVWHSPRKYLAIPLLVAGVALSFVSLPEAWFGRMETIAAYSSEGSAMQRLEVWRTGLAHALEHPWVGAGFEGWRYVTLDEQSLRARDWHSAYVEVAAEHGLPGLALWGALLFGSMASLGGLARSGARRADAWQSSHAAMLRASLAGYAVGAAFLGIAYWDLLFQMVLVSALIARLSRPAPNDMSVDNVVGATASA